MSRLASNFGGRCALLLTVVLVVGSNRVVAQHTREASEVSVREVPSEHQTPKRAKQGVAPAAGGGDWCQTWERWNAKIGVHGGVAGTGCQTMGTCDLPYVRDSWIPGVDTPIVTLRMKFNVFCKDNGTNCAATLGDVDAQMTQLNSDYLPYRIQWVATTEFINDGTYRWCTSLVEDAGMKAEHADSPDTQLNVYVVSTFFRYAGLGTFPWDPDATGAQGGVIIDLDWFGAGQKTLTHETGHCLGLWHTHHGVSEFARQPCFESDGDPCDCPCYERADGLDGDTTGDFASETAPTPVWFQCSDPQGNDACSSTPWAPTDPQNYMGYAPDSCYSEFSPQQVGRMHCWTDDILAGWRANGLRVTPSSNLSFEGPAGGPFTPGGIVYTLENLNATGINYSVTKTQPWVSLSDTGGFLAGFATTDVTVSISSSGDSLLNGNYVGAVDFINTTDHDGDTARDVNLRVATVRYSWDMSTDPEWWPMPGGFGSWWAWGEPTGGGGTYGGPDPTSGATGDNVYGFNLYGEYQSGLPEVDVMTGAIDCTGFRNTKLAFQRWLGVEYPWDHAYVRVIIDGAYYTTVWENTTEIADTAWSLQEIDISAVADDQELMQLQWIMGPTDGFIEYCGWNIDDVEVVADAGCAAGPEPVLAGWGENGIGQINVPAGRFTAVAGGGYHSYAIRTDGTLAGWGNNTFQQMNVPDGTYRAVASGWSFGLALDTNGRLVGWGRNNRGQTNVPAGAFTTVAAGNEFGLAIRTDSTLVGWGDDSYRQLYNLPGGTFTAVAAGARFGLAIRTDGTLVGWGSNLYGQTNVPLGMFTAVAGGGEFGLAIRTNGTLVGWGEDSYGQVADIPPGTFTAVAAGDSYGLAIRSDGKLVGWGSNFVLPNDVPEGVYTVIAAGAFHDLAIGGTVPPPLPLIETGEEAKTNRYLRFSVPQTADGVEEVIRVKVISLDGFPIPDPDVFYVGAPFQAPEEDTSQPGLTFTAAPFQCEPYTHDWSTEAGIISAYGAEIMPGSVYDVQWACASCPDFATDEGCWSDPLTITTAKFGDIWPLFDDPANPPQPDFSDIAAIQRKFNAQPGAPIKVVCQLQPNCVFPMRPIDFRDIAKVVNAFVGTPYSALYHGPCPCPASVTCGVTACTDDPQCVGFGDGLCVGGFCADKCGRCSP